VDRSSPKCLQGVIVEASSRPGTIVHPGRVGGRLYGSTLGGPALGGRATALNGETAVAASNPSQFDAGGTARVGPRSPRRKADSIVARRQELMTELAALRARCGSSRFLENAEQLLTRWWSAATWNRREQILKSAGWLIRLEQRLLADVRPEADAKTARS
jgi:hypothetical protein